MSSLLVLHLARALTAGAQSERVGSAFLEGTVRDSVGQPMRRTQVCTTIEQRPRLSRMFCGWTDSTGAYRVESLPASRLLVTVTCSGVRPFSGRVVGSDSIELATAAPVRRDWVVSRVGCDPRAIRRVTGIFRGHYTPGFESSRFVPCAADAWFIPGDSLETLVYDARRAWARFRPNVVHQRPEWPTVERDSDGNPRFYVRWRGTVEGPGQYGHLGISPFEIWVDSLIEIRAPTKADCQ